MAAFAQGITMTETTHSEATQQMWRMIQSIRFAMLTTEDGGHLRARPMVAAQDEFDGSLWFFTRASSHKVQEAAHSPVCVTYADGGKQEYVSLSGHAELVTDRATLHAHWSEPVRTWFPAGKDDPDLALLRVHVDAAEYWDAPNHTMVHAYGYLKAVLTGTSPHPGGNEKITFT